jgi:hypothetical protein
MRHAHEAPPLTLAAVGDRNHLLSGSELANVLGAEQIENAVLVDYSYGGLVIVGVADRVPERATRWSTSTCISYAELSPCGELTRGPDQAY